MPLAGPQQPLSPLLTLAFALSSGLCVANIYYAQPLVGPIAQSLHLNAGLAGLIMTVIQMGYCLGLLLVVPLADSIENRGLILMTMGGTTLGLLGISLATSTPAFFVFCFVVGVCAVATQVLVPLASHLVPEGVRGKTVGNIMAGLLGGIMLARPFASLVAAAAGWRMVFVLSAALMAAMSVLLWRALPKRLPQGGGRYVASLRSLPGIVRSTPILRRRALYQGLLFAGFQVFWTAVPLALRHEFGTSQRGIALFALAGAAGALAAPWAGRLADRGLTRGATGCAIVAALLSFVLGGVAMHERSMAGLVGAAILLDAAVQICNVLSLRSLYVLAPELRGRLNGLFLTFIFLCAALASGAAAAIYDAYGWTALCGLGAALCAGALLYFAGEVSRHGPRLSRAKD